MPGRQRADAAVQRVGRGHAAPQEEAGVAGGLGRGIDVAAGQQRLDLGGEAQGAVVVLLALAPPPNTLLILEPMLAPICAEGPSLPALPPDDRVRIVTIALNIEIRPRISPF